MELLEGSTSKCKYSYFLQKYGFSLKNFFFFFFGFSSQSTLKQIGCMSLLLLQKIKCH